jgi:Ca2+-binding EF-hand superfamily protein
MAGQAYRVWDLGSFKDEIAARVYKNRTSLRKMFRGVDVPGVGVIAKEEMQVMLETMNLGGANLDAMVGAVLDEADEDGSGAVAFAAFARALKPPDPTDPEYQGYQHIANINPASPKGLLGYPDTPPDTPELVVAASPELSVGGGVSGGGAEGGCGGEGGGGDDETKQRVGAGSARVSGAGTSARTSSDAQNTGEDGATAPQVPQVPQVPSEDPTTFALFKLGVIERLVHTDSMAEIRTTMAAIVKPPSELDAAGEGRKGAGFGGDGGDRGDGDGDKKDEETESLSSVEIALNTLQASLAAHGARGIHGLGRKFRIMDEEGSGALTFDEFEKMIREHAMTLSSRHIQDLFDYFDGDKSGTISYDEFLRGVRGVLNARRHGLVEQAYAVLDADGSGTVDILDIMKVYDASKHPDVVSGLRTKAEVFREFLDTFDGGTNHEKDGIVTLDEFAEYYAGVSASIDSDDFFELMIRNAWHISGGEGWCENTTNRRVHVAWEDGSHTIEEVEDDLRVGANVARIRAQFEERAGMAVKHVDIVGNFSDDRGGGVGGGGGGAASLGGEDSPTKPEYMGSSVVLG